MPVNLLNHFQTPPPPKEKTWIIVDTRTDTVVMPRHMARPEFTSQEEANTLAARWNSSNWHENTAAFIVMESE